MASDEEPQNPFEFLLRDLARAMSAQGVDVHRLRAEFAELALSAAEVLGPEHRAPIEELGRVASRYLPESRVAKVLGLEHELSVRALHPRDGYAELVAELGDYLALLEQAVAGSMTVSGNPAAQGDPFGFAAISQLAQQAGPMIVNAQLGSVLGHFALASLSRSELVLPRPARSDVTVFPLALEAMAREVDAPVAEVALWVILEDAARGPIVAAPVVADRLDVELRLFLLDLRADAEALGKRLTEGGGLARLANVEDLSSMDLAALFEAPESPARTANLRELTATAAFVVGVAGAALLELRPRLFGRATWIDELVDRREQAPAIAALASLFGMELPEINAHAERFAAQLVLRDDAAELVARALGDAEAFPTLEELGDVASWAARVALGEGRPGPNASDGNA